MRLEYKNTNFNLNIKITNNNVGLIKNDKWCNIKLNIKNNDIEYSLNKEILTKNELIKIISLIKEEENKYLKFIKNYLTIKYYKNNKNKYIDIMLIKIKNSKFKNYKIILKNQEINTFQKLIEKNIAKIIY